MAAHATLDDDILLTYSGPFARIPRPMLASSVRSLLAAGGLLFVLGGLAILPVLFGWTRLRDSNEAGFALLAAGSFVTGVPLVLLSRAPVATLNAVFAPLVSIGFAIAVANCALAVLFAGPTFPAASVFFGQVQLLAFIGLRRRWAVLVTCVAMLGLALALSLLDDPVAPVQHFFNVAVAAVATAVLVGGLAERLDTAQSRLSDVNRRLRRFLAPQVAAAVVANEVALAPHRSHIAACFVDLRGFTAFTNAVEPQQVVEVLGEYYQAVGSTVDAFGGTIGGFDGDGVFAFLGDPVPNANAAADAVAMAKAIATQLDALTTKWSSVGSQLGYGIGLAHGEATIGVVGFEGRLDYSPVGACVNLASRLCGDATNAEILIDEGIKQGAAVTGLRQRPTQLKGFGEITAYGMTH